LGPVSVAAAAQLASPVCPLQHALGQLPAVAPGSHQVDGRPADAGQPQLALLLARQRGQESVRDAGRRGRASVRPRTREEAAAGRSSTKSFTPFRAQVGMLMAI
jgi:hypothetical protein